MNLDSLLHISRKSTVVIPFPYDTAILKTMHAAETQNWARFICIGDADKISELAGEQNIPAGKFEFLPAEGETEACEKAAQLVQEGTAQLAMKGQVHTAEFCRALFRRETGLLPEGNLVSHVALCDIPGYRKPLFLTDCAINITPNLDEKVKIIENAVSIARNLGILIPKVGLVAPVETVNEKIESTVHGKQLKELFAYFSDTVVDGPFGLDVALSGEAAEVKNVDSPVAGDADILLFHDLNSANAVYKTMTILCGASVAGILVGLTVPVVITSRADNENTKLISLRMGIALSQNQPQGQ